MKYLFTILTVTLTLFSCNLINTHKLPGKEELIHKITKQVANDTYKEKELIPFGFGGGAMHEIRMLSLSYAYRKTITIEEARELLVFSVNKYVDAINANEQIRPYLLNYPFETKNIKISIYIQDRNNLNPDRLWVVNANKGVFQYYIHHPVTENLVQIHQETYAQAVENIEASKQKSG